MFVRVRFSREPPHCPKMEVDSIEYWLYEEDCKLKVKKVQKNILKYLKNINL